MHAFRTTFNIPESSHKILYTSRCMFLGSCFSEHIGTRLSDRKFIVDNNPFGILYNPGSIYKSVKRMVEARKFEPSDLMHFDHQWISLSHHGQFSHPDQESCLEHINKRLLFSSEFIKTADFLFLTFGTSWIFEWKETGDLVANCHKIPSRKFQRKLLKPQQIISMYNDLDRYLKGINPNLKIIFTISPIRHWKESATGNQRSKSILHFAIHELMEAHPEWMYFPAYELMMDDLRDYRYYADDMVHLSNLAIHYIWEKFQETFLDKSTRIPMAKVEKILAAVAHRPDKKHKSNLRTFAAQQLEKISELKATYPDFDFSSEEYHFRHLTD